jgi:hypothetical protein
MLRITVEIPPHPLPYMERPSADHLTTALANRITDNGTIYVTPTEEGGFVVTAALEVVNAVEHHRDAANGFLSAVNGLGLYAVRLVATRVATRAAEGFFTGLVGGLGASAPQKSELAPWITLFGGLFGSIIGSAIEKEIKLFEWQRDTAGRWYELGGQPGLGWQPA